MKNFKLCFVLFFLVVIELAHAQFNIGKTNATLGVTNQLGTDTQRINPLSTLPTLPIAPVYSTTAPVYNFNSFMEKWEMNSLKQARGTEYEDALEGIMMPENEAKATILPRRAAICKYAVDNLILGNESVLLDPVCNLRLATLTESCALDRRISESEFLDLVDDLKKSGEKNPDQLKMNCLTELNNKTSGKTRYVPDGKSAGAIAVTVENYGWDPEALVKKPVAEMTRAEAQEYANKCYGSDLDSCNDFPNDLLEKSLGGLAKLYVVAAPKLGGGFLFFKKKTCDECFPEKFAFLQSGEPHNSAAQAEFKKDSDAGYNSYVREKSEEKIIAAYSEYAKHVDRKNSLNTMLGDNGGPRVDQCKSGANLVIQIGQIRNSPQGCVNDEEIKKRMGNVFKKFSPEVSAPQGQDEFLEGIVKSVENETFNYKNRLCFNKETPRSGFDRMRSIEFNPKHIEYINKARNDAVTKVAFAKCGESEQVCLVAALKEFLMRAGGISPRKDYTVEQEVEALIQQKYLANPYLRLIVQTKSGWTSASRMEMSNKVVDNFEKNRQELLALAAKDAESQCDNLIKDVAQALCIQPSNAMAVLGPAKVRAEFQRKIDAISKQDIDLKNKNLRILGMLGSACKAMDLNEDAQEDNNKSAFISDQSADVTNFADPVIRHRMVPYEKMGAKFGDDFKTYSDELCNLVNHIDKNINISDSASGGIGGLSSTFTSGFNSTFNGLGNAFDLDQFRHDSPIKPDGLITADVSLMGIHLDGAPAGKSGGGGITISSSGFSGSGSLASPCFGSTCENKLSVGQESEYVGATDEQMRQALRDPSSYASTYSTPRSTYQKDRTPLFVSALDDKPLGITSVIPSDLIVPISDLSQSTATKDPGGVSQAIKGDSVVDNKSGTVGGQTNDIDINGAGSLEGTALKDGDGNPVQAGSQLAGNGGLYDDGTETMPGQQTGKMQVGPGGRVLPNGSGYGSNFRSIASVQDDGGRSSGFSRRADYGQLESTENRQSNIELELMKQLTQTQLQSTQMQRQVSEMRLEMERLRQSTSEALVKASEIRTQNPKAKKNVFDAPVESSSDEESVTDGEDEVVTTLPVKTKVTKQSGAQGNLNKPVSSDFATPEGFGSLSPSGGRKPTGDEIGSNGNSGQVGGNRNVGVGSIVSGGGLGASASSGSLAGGGSGSIGGSRGASFTPSLVLQESITPSSTVETLPQERKVELLQEFLGYVEKNPGYQDGRYLNTANSQVVIDFQGRSLVVKVEDIADGDLRSQLQERLLRQRVLLNQFTRSKRLATLQRLLAQTRGGATP